MYIKSLLFAVVILKRKQKQNEENLSFGLVADGYLHAGLRGNWTTRSAFTMIRLDNGHIINNVE